MIDLVALHMIDGRVVNVNPMQITQLVHPREEKGGSHGHRVLVEGVRCVVRLTDGGFVSVAETCDEVEKLMEESK